MLVIQFRSSKEIEKYYREQYKKGNLKDLKTSTGKTIPTITDDILKDAAVQLQKCVQKWLEQYYLDYVPKYYKRTKRPGGLRDSLEAEASVHNIGERKTIGLYFDDSKVWGKSRVSNYNSDGFKPWLINDGYKDRSFKTPHFLGYEGYGFIEKGIAEWKATYKYAKYIDVKRIIGYDIINM